MLSLLAWNAGLCVKSVKFETPQQESWAGEESRGEQGLMIGNTTVHSLSYLCHHMVPAQRDQVLFPSVTLVPAQAAGGNMEKGPEIITIY